MQEGERKNKSLLGMDKGQLRAGSAGSVATIAL